MNYAKTPKVTEVFRVGDLDLPEIMRYTSTVVRKRRRKMHIYALVAKQ